MLKLRLYDGSFHEVDSSEFAFKIAGSMAFQAAAKRAKPVILEPVMKMEVVTPEDFFGQVISDLSSRRGKIKETSERVGMKVIDAVGSVVRNIWICHINPFINRRQSKIYNGI